MTKIAQPCAHAIINLQDFNDVAEAACDAAVRRLCPVCGVSSGLNQKTTAS